VETNGIFGGEFISLDSRYVVSDIYVAKYSITSVLGGLAGKALFGTGFPTVRRRYPVIRVLDEFIIVFDPSEA
jgi:hypothetical protein